MTDARTDLDDAGSRAAGSNFLTVTPYTAPEWARGLKPIPEKMFRLGHFPTPIHRWNVPDLPAGTELWIKRDDLSGMQLSGNKVRKLEFLMAQAVEEGADCVITIGGIQSNHCRATAVAARYAGMDAFLILRTSRAEVESDPGLVGNLLVERMVGAHIDLVTKEEYQRIGSVALGEMLAERLRAEGRRPYVIPVGGSNALGSWGYVEMVRELQSQTGVAPLPPLLLSPGAALAGSSNSSSSATGFNDIVMACGSGGTTAGLSLACHLSGLGARVHAYCVCDDPTYFYDFTQEILDGMGAGVASKDICTIRNAKGAGYAISTAEEIAFATDIARTTGVVLDPVYSGKALFGLLKDMRASPKEWEGRRILFIHTGGLLGMYEKAPQLQPLMGRWRRFHVEGGRDDKMTGTHP